MPPLPDTGYCRTCKQDSLLNRRGRCTWCGAECTTPPSTRTKAGANVNRGVPVMMSEDVLERAQVMHRQGVSIRAVAAVLHPETGYSTAKSMATALSTHFRHRGWYARERVEATVKAHLVHGKLRRGKRDPAKIRELRIARGEVRGVQCAGIKKNPPRQGEQCRHAALAGGIYCAQHDPARQAALRDKLAEMRSRIGAA